MHTIYLKGYEKFKKNYFKDNQELFDNLAKGQKPHTMVITCSDSRIELSVLLSSNPGELFIARNIGNIVPPYGRTQGATQAAIEYAVNALKVEHIVILGHSSCGACEHLYHEKTEEEKHVELSHVDEWLTLAYPAKNTSMLECLADPTKDRSEVTEKNNIVLSLQTLMTYPYIIKGIENKTLQIHGWWHNIKTGDMEVYDYGTKTFTKVDI
ncbi:MAG: carbonic anhydrase [Epsilonproteobacteria bacterium]|nr:carbonic anhydrase [Campylobacterota bacterium]